MARVYACLCGPPILAAAVLILSASALLASDDAQKAQKKDLEQAAKAAIAEAKQLESSGKLVDARFKFAESLGYFPEKDAEHAIKHLDDELKKSAKEKIEAAEKLYESARYQDAAQTLEDALLLETFKPLIYYNLALCHFQLKNGSLAAEYLDRARASAFTPKMRARLAEMRTIFTTAESPASAANLRKQAEQFNHLAELVGNGATLEDDLGDEEDDDPAAPNPPPAPLPQLARSAVSSNTAQNLHAGKGTRFASACEQLQPLKPAYAASAAFAYDSAGCAEDNNRPDEAAALLGKYLELSPNALDRARTSQRIADLEQLRDLSDSSAPEVRRLYAAASRAAEERKYDRTLADYKKAAALAPDFPLTHWRLALLLESMGDVRPARAEYQRFLELSKDEDLRQRATFHLELLDEKKQKYDDEVSEAAEIFAYLFNRAMNLTFNSGLENRSALRAKRDRPKHRGEDKSAKYKLGGFYTVPFEYGQQQVAEAAGHLITATSIFPLGPEANELMGLVYLQALDGRSALRAFDAVASQNIPVSFYGELRGHNIDRPVKCELSADHIRFIFLAQNYDKKGFANPPSRPAHEDGLGDLVIPPDASRPMNFEDVVYRLSDVKRIETRGVLIAIRLQHEDYSLAPLFVTAMPPTEGPPARRFTNDYVRLFMRYPGLEDSKLGAEGLSGGEKFKLGMNIANAAMNISMGGAGMFAAIQDVMTIRATALMLQRSFASTHIKFAAWEQSVSDQQDLLIGNPFKPIPLDPLRLTYAQEFK